MSTEEQQSLRDIYKRLDWMDEKVRQSNRKLAELEQKLELSQREISTRDQRIQTLERQLADTKSKLTGLDYIEPRFIELRKEIIALVDKSDERRETSLREIERLRSAEQQATTREIANILKALPVIPRLQDAIEQRKEEESRLSQMIAAIQNQFQPINHRIDQTTSSVTYVDESVKQLVRQVAELQTQALTLNKRQESAEHRIESTALGLTRYDPAITALERVQSDLTKQMKTWFEQVRISEYDRNRRVDAWQEVFDTYKNEMAKLQKEWGGVFNQLNESKIALSVIPEWRKQIEQQQKESSELARVELQRFAARLEQLSAENERFWKTIQLENEQHRTTYDRRQSEFANVFKGIDDRIEALRQQKELLTRIQSAQTDAIKRMPTLWIEEVEKAITHDPNRRRQPQSTPTPEE